MSPASDDPPAGTGRLILFGVLVYPILVWGFSARGEATVLDGLFLAAVVELLPILAVAQLPLVEAGKVDRMAAYLGSSLTIAFLGSTALVLGALGPGLETLGLGAVPPSTVLGWGGGTVLAALVLMAGFHSAARSFGIAESRLLRELIPKTGPERVAFTGLSLVAGFGEEVVYRGYAIPMMAPVLDGEWNAALFTSASFGVLHAYQGPLGMVRTGTLGFVLASVFLATDSLWPVVVAHAGINLVGGLVLGDRFTS